MRILAGGKLVLLDTSESETVPVRYRASLVFRHIDGNRYLCVKMSQWGLAAFAAYQEQGGSKPYVVYHDNGKESEFIDLTDADLTLMAMFL